MTPADKLATLTLTFLFGWAIFIVVSACLLIAAGLG